jgi:hypothetical protein
MIGPMQPPGLPGEDDPVYQTWVMLLNGYGYNWYRLENQLRADDLLIRSRASEHLAAAAARLREIEARYRRTYLPPPTRARPDHDPEHLAAVRRMRSVAERILDVDTRVRGAAVPPNDMVWLRHRDETDMLFELSRCDTVLVGAAKELADVVIGLPLDAAVDAAAERSIDDRLQLLAAVLGRRVDLLA